MTLEQLSQYPQLEKGLRDARRELFDVRQKFSAVSSPALTGMPSGSPRNGNNKIEQYVSKICDLQKSIEEKQRQYNEIRQYITDIPDYITRKIFKKRFFENMKWSKVAEAVGGNNTEDSVKKRCYRYVLKNLEKNKRCPEILKKQCYNDIVD